MWPVQTAITSGCKVDTITTTLLLAVAVTTTATTDYLVWHYRYCFDRRPYLIIRTVSTHSIEWTWTVQVSLGLKIFPILLKIFYKISRNIKLVLKSNDFFLKKGFGKFKLTTVVSAFYLIEYETKGFNIEFVIVTLAELLKKYLLSCYQFYVAKTR